MSDSKERALMEAHAISGEDAYFAARPRIDSEDRRKVFEAGFVRGWQARAQQPEADDLQGSADPYGY